jgi:lipoprotein-anchoring transpeptidase ErfK/SrfK
MRRLRWPLILALVVLSLPLLSPHPAAALDCFAPETLGCQHGLPIFQYQLLLTEMMAFPLPEVRPLSVDTDEIAKFSLYKVVREAITFYDAPNGNPSGTLDAGFNYLAVRRREGDWYEIRQGQWVHKSALTYSRASAFSGVLIDKPLPYPMAWVLTPVRPSSIPGQEADENTPRLARYTRLNIYHAVKVGDWEWYLVGPGQWVEQRRVAQVLPATKPAEIKGRWVSIDLFEQVLTAYDGDRLVFATLVASGLPKWPTNEGVFRIWARLRTDAMSGAMGQPDFYYLQSVPYVMYFDGAIALHGAYWHDGFGYRHSHGCVNMSVSDSRWLFEWTSNFYADAQVYVWSSGQYRD